MESIEHNSGLDSVIERLVRRSPDNYRPVSLLSLCSKILEKVVYDCLLRHCLSALPETQHGFLRNRSCVTNLACFLDHAWQSIALGTQTDAIYTDFTSALIYICIVYVYEVHKP